MITQPSTTNASELYTFPEGAWPIRKAIKGLLADGRIYDFYCRTCLKNHAFAPEMPLLYSSRGICQDCRQIAIITNPHLTNAIQAELKEPILESDFQNPFSLASVMEDLLIPYPLPSTRLFLIKERLFQKIARSRPLLKKARLERIVFPSLPDPQDGEKPLQFPAVAYSFNRYMGQLITQKRLHHFFCTDCLTQKGFTPNPDPFFTDSGQCQECRKVDDIENPYISAYLTARGVRFDQFDPSTNFIRDLVIPWPMPAIITSFPS